MKSLELNWIRKFDKSLVTPEVVFSDDDRIGGCYYPPDKNSIFLNNDGKEYSMDNGIIEVSRHWPEDFQSTLAHEWRHHWQVFNHDEYVRPYKWDMDTAWEDYEECAKKYFILNLDEMDALKFQYRFASIHPIWEEWFYDYLKD